MDQVRRRPEFDLLLRMFSAFVASAQAKMS